MAAVDGPGDQLWQPYEDHPRLLVIGPIIAILSERLTIYSAIYLLTEQT